MTRCTCGGQFLQSRRKQRLPRITPVGTIIVEYTLYDCDTCGTTRLLDPVMIVPLPEEWRDDPIEVHHANAE